MDDTFLAQLKAITGDNGVLNGPAVSDRTTGFSPPGTTLARTLVRPRSTEEVSAVLKLAHAARQPVVTHGGRTGLVHGADAGPGESFFPRTHDCDREIDPYSARRRCRQVSSCRRCKKPSSRRSGFPLDLGARGTATLGGNVATNAGGNRVSDTA